MSTDDQWLFNIALVAIGLLLFLWRRRPRKRWQRPQKRRRHERNVQAARAVFLKLRDWKGPGLRPRMLAYLRKIDALVFEELVLTAFEAGQGLSIIRNDAYTGDGGIDGRVYLNGHLYLIQAKRYEGAIDAQHVREFCEVVLQQEARGGIFVHTGRTPPGAYRQLAQHRQVILISGDRLVQLMQANPLELLAFHRQS